MILTLLNKNNNSSKSIRIIQNNYNNCKNKIILRIKILIQIKKTKIIYKKEIKIK